MRADNDNPFRPIVRAATWTGSGSLSGVVSCTTTTYSAPDTASGNLSGACTDVAGNTSSAVGFAFRYDATPPAGVHGVAARAADHNGWYNHPADIAFTGTDATSGIDSCTSSTYSGPDSASATVAGRCTDVCRNATAIFGPFNYDAAPATSAIDGDIIQVVIAGTPLTRTANDKSLRRRRHRGHIHSARRPTRDPHSGRTAGCGTATHWSVDTSGLLGVYAVAARTAHVAGNPGDGVEHRHGRGGVM